MRPRRAFVLGRGQLLWTVQKLSNLPSLLRQSSYRRFPLPAVPLPLEVLIPLARLAVPHTLCPGIQNLSPGFVAENNWTHLGCVYDRLLLILEGPFLEVQKISKSLIVDFDVGDAEEIRPIEFLTGVNGYPQRKHSRH